MKNVKRISVTALILVLTLLFSTLLVNISHAGTTWTYETVTQTGDIGEYSSIALDSSGNPSISYYHRTDGDLWYAEKTGPLQSDWVKTRLDTAGDVGMYTSLALDSSDNPHISYYDYTSGNLKYAYVSSYTWWFETVDSIGDVGWWTSIALDSSGNPHISYYDPTNGDLKYASRSSMGVWSTTTVDSTDIVGLCTSIALDSYDRPCISYYDYTNADLKYASRSSMGVWSTTTVDSTGFVGQYTSLALDSSNNPHISYYAFGIGDLKYASRSSMGVWSTTTVDGSTGDFGLYTSIALDSAGNPYISYYDKTNGDLKYAKFAGLSDGWLSVTVDSSGDLGRYSSIALTSSFGPCISYYDTTNGDLKYVFGFLRDPIGSIVINGGDATTTSPSVTLSLTYSAYGASVSQVRYSNDGVWDTEPWEDPAAIKAWTLTDGDGIKTVYYQVKDSEGMLSSTFSDTIELDTGELLLEQIRTWWWISGGRVWSVASADVDSDGDVEVVTGGSYDNGPLWVAQLCIWDGATLSPENIKTWYWTGDTEIWSVAIGDVDGDGQNEVVTGGYYDDGSRWNAQLCVWDGATLALENVQTWYWTSYTRILSVAVGDVDGDGQTEIITGGEYADGTLSNAQLCVWDGATLALENVQTWRWGSRSIIWSVAVGDVNLDGDIEIVTGGDCDDGSRFNAQLCVWDGATLALENIRTWYWIDNTFINSVAVGDVDGDAQIEIVTGGLYWDGTRSFAQLCVWKGATLSPENIKTWYWTGATTAGEVAIGDVDGDGQMEIMTGGGYGSFPLDVAQLCVWDGATLALENVQTWQWTGYTFICSVATEDVDADGRLEIMTGGYYFDGTRQVAQLCVWG